MHFARNIYQDGWYMFLRLRCLVVEFTISLLIAPFISILLTIFPARVIGFNQGFGAAFGRIKSQFRYVFINFAFILVISTLVSIFVGFFESATVAIFGNGAAFAAIILAQTIGIVPAVYFGSVQMVLVCRAYVRADFVIAQSGTSPLDMPYLADERFELLLDGAVQS